MILMIDNYDSFVYNLVHYLQMLNYDVLVYKNDEITVEEIRRLDPSHIVLSPGPSSPKNSAVCLDIMKHLKNDYPILGICLGMQIISYALGGEIIKAKQPTHGKVHLIENNTKGIYSTLPHKFHVTRYHSLVLDPKSLPNELSITARSIIDDEIMSVSHTHLPIVGIQYHPEALLSEYGLNLLENFMKHIQ